MIKWDDILKLESGDKLYLKSKCYFEIGMVSEFQEVSIIKISNFPQGWESINLLIIGGEYDGEEICFSKDDCETEALISQSELDEILKYRKIEIEEIKSFLIKNKLSFNQMIKAFNYWYDLNVDIKGRYTQSYSDGEFDKIGWY